MSGRCGDDGKTAPYRFVAIAPERNPSFLAVFFSEAEKLCVDGFKLCVCGASAACDTTCAKMSVRERYGAAVAIPVR